MTPTELICGSGLTTAHSASNTQVQGVNGPQRGCAPGDVAFQGQGRSAAAWLCLEQGFAPQRDSRNQAELSMNHDREDVLWGKSGCPRAHPGLSPSRSHPLAGLPEDSPVPSCEPSSVALRNPASWWCSGALKTHEWTCFLGKYNLKLNREESWQQGR